MKLNRTSEEVAIELHTYQEPKIRDNGLVARLTQDTHIYGLNPETNDYTIIWSDVPNSRIR